ncbi:MAG: MATE family efflux transporter, partial [Lachnospiraceae bacterium]|nr:MATE family efflux transporter [Lachnospiraceae bacterium]
MEKDELEWLRNGEKLSTTGELKTIINLSIPAILSQITTVAMEYCDASMVGHIGSNAGAAIGLVTSTTWLIHGITMAVGTGFSVQVAHRIGAGRFKEARALTRRGLIT